ncbi:MAG TPA: phosphoglycolate phosphatase [Gammaproteobacteria bacterium]|nr:phosphoglycolate phosphatase [Gammaproteobacteria bacterium]
MTQHLEGRRLEGVELAAFDLDGTLVDSAPDLSHCLGCALDSVGLARPTEDETRSWIGDGVEQLVRRGVEHMEARRDRERTPPRRGADPASPQEPRGSAADYEAAYAEFLRCYERNLYVRTRLYPQVEETLDALRDRGIRLCCVTNKRVRFAEAVLEEARIRDRFELVVGGDSLPEKKPSPAQLRHSAERFRVAPAAALLVGDSENDCAAAKAAGWSFVWAAYGYGRPAQQDVRIESFEELTALVAPRP